MSPMIKEVTNSPYFKAALNSIPTLDQIFSLAGERKALFWDMDGTLLHTEPHHIAAGLKLLCPQDLDRIKNLGPGQLEKMLRECTGMADPAVFDYLKEKGFLKNQQFNLENYLQRKSQYFLDELQNQKNKQQMVTPQILSLLNQARHKKMMMILVTASEDRLARETLKNLELDSFFDDILTRSSTTKTKPSPDPYQEALRRAQGLSPTLKSQDILVLEDSLTGMSSAHAATLDFLWARWFEQAEYDLDFLLHNL